MEAIKRKNRNSMEHVCSNIDEYVIIKFLRAMFPVESHFKLQKEGV